MENRWTPISICFLAVAILVSSIYLGTSLKNQALPTNVNVTKSKSEDILTVIEAAAFIKVPIPTVYEMVENSKNDEKSGIPYYMINGEIRFSKQALSNWMVNIANFKYEYNRGLTNN